jgi:acyl-CoA thioester hydrolase
MLGFEHRELSSALSLVFAVRGLQVEFLAPALMDDLLLVETRMEGTRGAIVEFRQRILRDRAPLVEANVRVATLKNGRASRPPRELLARLRTS